jgi:hypothetical protein
MALAPRVEAPATARSSTLPPSHSDARARASSVMSSGLTARAVTWRHSHWPSPRLGVAGAEGGEVDGAVRADQGGLGEGQAAQAGGEFVGADEERRAVGGLEGEQAAVGVEGRRAGGLVTAAGAGEAPALQGREDVGQQGVGRGAGGPAAGLVSTPGRVAGWRWRGRRRAGGAGWWRWARRSPGRDGPGRDRHQAGRPPEGGAGLSVNSVTPGAHRQANTFQARAVRLPKSCGFWGSWLVGR